MSMTAERDDPRTVRPAVVAGMFYPGAPDALREAIAQAFRSPFGPGVLPVTQAGPRQLAGIVVPHAGYQYSGPCAACAYAAVARDGRPAAVVLLGVNHHGIGAPLAVSPAMHWQTPLGEMPVATALRERLLQRVAGVKADNRAHQQEHSLEVQVPFLQYLFGEVPILPISLGMPPLNAVLELG